MENQIFATLPSLPKLLTEIYGDLAKPGVKQMGRALETVTGLGNTILWPLALLNGKSKISLEKNLEKYRLEMAKVEDECVVSVPPEIGVPIAEKMSYITDENLSNLYVRLLATASNKNTINTAHPSFVNVINNLSPDEGVLLKYISNNLNIPFIIATAFIPDTGGSTHLGGMIIPDDANEGLIFPENMDAYLSNLSGLGLIAIKSDQWIADDSVYEEIFSPFKNNLNIKNAMSSKFPGCNLQYEKGVIVRTGFGSKFIEACRISF